MNKLDRPDEDAEGQFPGVRVASSPSPHAIERITEVDAAASEIVLALGFPQ